MPKSKNFLAVDLGATSGRTVLGMVGEDSLQLCEVSRFPNTLIAANGHYYWNLLGLYHSLVTVNHFSPQEQSMWADHYEHFMEITAKGAGTDH